MIDIETLKREITESNAMRAAELTLEQRVTLLERDVCTLMATIASVSNLLQTLVDKVSQWSRTP